MKLQTPVIDEACKVGISYNDKIMMIGSCFTENIGRQLADYGFDVEINPFGTLYNPISVLNSIERLISGRQFTQEDCIQIGAGDTRWCSFSHHTSFARQSPEEFVADANNALERSHKHFMQSNKVIITLGTSWCFRHNATRQVVSNCLKRPASEFVRERLASNEVTSALRRIVDLCNDSEYMPEGMIPKQFIFTVSPIRHFKDGAHGNQISKSALLLGIDLLASLPADLSMDPYYIADYFPAYEIVMDELRDYRFYAEDMCHPSTQTVHYICERFLDWALPASEHEMLQENIRQHKRNNHLTSYKSAD
ncbi:MAG: GSCFA domain-containing protein [Bacteroidales bacterium]|nr:GSCFA domain-containing protein [Bacteroidales bacterium]